LGYDLAVCARCARAPEATVELGVVPIDERGAGIIDGAGVQLEVVEAGDIVGIIVDESGGYRSHGYGEWGCEVLPDILD